MKKLLFLFATICPLLFSSCNKDDSFTLNGTFWKSQLEYDDTPYFIEFIGENRVIAFIDDYQYDEGTYRLNGSTVTFSDLEVASTFGTSYVYKSAVLTNNTLMLTYVYKKSDGTLGSEDKRIYIKQ